MTKGKSKYVSFAAQREQCRLNKFTYTEKCSCGIVSLMCNYPFEDPKHKKGMCRASTCTDMRKTLADDIAAISEPEESVSVEDKLAPGHHGLDDVQAGEDNASSEESPALSGVDGAYDEANAKEDLPEGAVRAE